MTKKVAKFVVSLDETGKFPDNMIMGYFVDATETHAKTVAEEKKRKEDVKLMKE